MQGLSERQQVIKDLFLILAFIHLEDLEEMLDHAMKLPVPPTFGLLIFPNNQSLKRVYEVLFSEEEEVSELLHLISSKLPRTSNPK
jgi:hypothetical protein